MRGWFARLLVVTATCQLVIFALRPVLTYQALSLDASTAELGLLVSSFSVVSLAAAVPIGRGIDRHGERGYLLAGAALIPIAVGLMVAARGLGLLMTAGAVLGLGQLLTMISCQTIIANDRDAERRDAHFANFTLVTSTAQFAAPAMAGLLIAGDAPSEDSAEIELGSVQTAAGLAAAIGLVAALSLVCRPGSLAQRPQHFGVPAPGAIAHVLRDRTVVMVLVVGFCGLSAVDLLVAFLPAYGQAHGLSPALVGLLLSVHGLAAIIVRLRMVRLLQRFTRRGLLLTCLLVAAVGLAAVPFVPSVPGLVGLMVVTGASLGLCQPIAIAWLAGAVPPEVRGTAMSLRMAGNRLGQTVVPLGVASLAGAAGVAAAFLGPATLLSLAGLLVYALGRNDGPQR
jgi:MFS family permease